MPAYRQEAPRPACSLCVSCTGLSEVLDGQLPRRAGLLVADGAWPASKRDEWGSIDVLLATTRQLGVDTSFLVDLIRQRDQNLVKAPSLARWSRTLGG